MAVKGDWQATEIGGKTSDYLCGRHDSIPRYLQTEGANARVPYGIRALPCGTVVGCQAKMFEDCPGLKAEGVFQAAAYDHPALLGYISAAVPGDSRADI